MESNSKTAIITGGGQGIGRGIAQKFIEGGYRVVVAEIDLEAGEEAVGPLKGSGEAIFVETDVSSEESVQMMISRTMGAFGRIDVLVNNAGVMSHASIDDLSLESWNRVLGTNLTGPFLCAKHASAHLRRRRGSIVNISSTRALMSEANTEAYSASKGGVVALTHALSISLGPEVRVNCISPGWIDASELKKGSIRRTAKLSDEDQIQHPCGRVGRVEDIASMAFFLASEQAGFITGANIVIDGGMTRKMIYI